MGLFTIRCVLWLSLSSATMTCRALLHSVRLPKQSSFTTQGSSRGLLTSVEGFGGLPYTLHAQCSDNNTILTLSLDSPRNGLWGSEHADRQKLGGKVVARITSGQVGFKKGQRGTFEAGAGTSSAMMKLIDTIQYPSRDLEASSRRYILFIRWILSAGS